MRKSRLDRRGRLSRTGGIRPVNPERKKRRRLEDRVYGSYYRVVANMPTCVGLRGKAGHVCRYYDDRRPEAHHLKHVGGGGQDAGNLLDCCHAMHDEFHSGATLDELQERHGLDFQAEADRLWRDFGEGQE